MGGGVAVLAGEEAARQVEGRLLDEGLQVPLDQGLPYQVDGWKEEVRGGWEKVSHKLCAGLHLSDHLEDDLSSICLLAQHVDLG